MFTVIDLKNKILDKNNTYVRYELQQEIVPAVAIKCNQCNALLILSELK